MALLAKDEILGAEDVWFEDVEVSEWGGTVRVQMMTGEARDRYEQQLFDAKKEEISLANIRAKLVAACVVDDKGNLLFGDKDIQALGRKSSRALDRVYAVCQKLNGMTDADVDELAKNSKADPSDDSTSA